jgi:hypothetical protein
MHSWSQPLSRWRSSSRCGFVAVCFPLIGACGSRSSTGPSQCVDRFVFGIAPANPVITINQSLQLTAIPSSQCPPNVPASALLWDSMFPTVATVDPTRGIVTGQGTGATMIFVRGPTGGALGLTVVQVTGP